MLMDDMCYNYYEDHVLNWKQHNLYIHKILLLTLN